jgi:hypothetical protein
MYFRLSCFRGDKFYKSLTGKYYKDYGMQVVNKKDGHPVRAEEMSLRFEIRPGARILHFFYWRIL